METYKQQIVDEIQREFGIDLTEVIQKGILDPYDAKKWLVKQLYYKLSKEDRTYTVIKKELSKRYNISVSTIEKMMYKKD